MGRGGEEVFGGINASKGRLDIELQSGSAFIFTRVVYVQMYFPPRIDAWRGRALCLNCCVRNTNQGLDVAHMCMIVSTASLWTSSTISRTVSRGLVVVACVARKSVVDLLSEATVHCRVTNSSGFVIFPGSVIEPPVGLPRTK